METSGGTESGHQNGRNVGINRGGTIPSDRSGNALDPGGFPAGAYVRVGFHPVFT
jgi:hypothetical protein